MTSKQKYQIILGMILCYIGTIYLPPLIKRFFTMDEVGLKFSCYALIQIGLCLSIIYYVLKIEKRPLSSIAFKKFKASRDIKWGLIGFGLGGMSFAITGPVLAIMGMETTMDGIDKLMAYPIWFRIGVALIAGTTEEVLFRAYPMERLSEWTGSIWIAGLLTVLLFAGLHIPFWSYGGAIQIGIGCIIWTLIYIKTRSIWTMVIMHVVNDLFAFVCLPYLFGAPM